MLPLNSARFRLQAALLAVGLSLLSWACRSPHQQEERIVITGAPSSTAAPAADPTAHPTPGGTALGHKTPTGPINATVIGRIRFDTPTAHKVTVNVFVDVPANGLPLRNSYTVKVEGVSDMNGATLPTGTWAVLYDQPGVYHDYANRSWASDALPGDYDDSKQYFWTRVTIQEYDGMHNPIQGELRTFASAANSFNGGLVPFPEQK